ncbi:hypothetical protein GINT2_001383 [Glugoides intestinalis]
MASLNFVMGPVASGKTVELILRANQLQTIAGNNAVMVFKPVIDVRFPSRVVRSATGLEIKTNALISPADNILELNLTGVQYIFIDEIQFFTITQIEQLRAISLDLNIEINCYGLLTDFKLGMFDVTKRLLELSDTIRNVKTYCMMCKDNRTVNIASHNLKILKGEDGIKPVVQGESICIGGIETFLPVCFTCYSNHTKTFTVN